MKIQMHLAILPSHIRTLSESTHTTSDPGHLGNESNKYLFRNYMMLYVRRVPL